jgi:hypothetical protein
MLVTGGEKNIVNTEKALLLKYAKYLSGAMININKVGIYVIRR